MICKSAQLRALIRASGIAHHLWGFNKYACNQPFTIVVVLVV